MRGGKWRSEILRNLYGFCAAEPVFTLRFPNAIYK
ncbi:hypothetical protein IMSAGC014_00854 [Bacteroidaceae bacterium]|nr:hypothetical protein IMSAGC014_00854 [Bacteroidaceae bacterium]